MSILIHLLLVCTRTLGFPLEFDLWHCFKLLFLRPYMQIDVNNSPLHRLSARHLSSRHLPEVRTCVIKLFNCSTCCKMLWNIPSGFIACWGCIYIIRLVSNVSRTNMTKIWIINMALSQLKTLFSGCLVVWWCRPSAQPSHKEYWPIYPSEFFHSLISAWAPIFQYPLFFSCSR